MATTDVNELYELILGVQAEMSALKKLMFDANPELAEKHQSLTNSIRADLLRAWRENRSR